MSVGQAATDPGLIASLYDAAVDDDVWHDFSKLVGKAAGIEDVAVWMTRDGELTDFSVVKTWRELLEPYRTHFSKIDPWAASIVRARPETVMLGYEHLPEGELVKTEFYNDFAKPGGMFRPMGVRLRLAPKTYATIGSDLPAAKTLFEEGDKVRLQILLPYIKGALKLRLRVGQQASRLGTALDRLAFGVVLCTAACRISFVNAEAETLARSGRGLVLGHGGKLGALLPGEAPRLRALVHDAATGGPGGGMRLSTRDGAVGLFVLVTPLPGAFGGGAGSGAMVALRRPDVSPAVDEKLLMDLFSLSRGQAAVAIAVHAGKSPAGIALERGVRVSTVRTQLIEIFARTGTSDQRDLIRMIGMLPALKAR